MQPIAIHQLLLAALLCLMIPSFSHGESLEGTIVQEQFQNKAGKPIPEVYDLFLETASNRYFIKTCAGDDIGIELTHYVACKVRVGARIHDGLWDACSNDHVQSRMGQYIEISTVTLIEDPYTYHFSDINNNVYTFNQHELSYDPIRQTQSSSGSYDGGEAKGTKLSTSQFEKLRYDFHTMIDNTRIQVQQRRMLTFLLSKELGDEYGQVIIESCQEVMLFERDLKAILLSKK